MKREIKFRGLRTDGKGWVFGDLLNPHEGNQSTWIAVENGHIMEVRPETVGQFTGLKDKNGNEIFEGDLINVHGRFSAFWRGAVVEYRAPSFVIQKKEGVCDEFRLDEWESDFEVIGNIHEQ